MGCKLVGAPQHFEYYDASGTSGCWYDAGKDASKEAHFGYVVFTSVEVYNSQQLYLCCKTQSDGFPRSAACSPSLSSSCIDCRRRHAPTEWKRRNSS
jgi:hypothetical protein